LSGIVNWTILVLVFVSGVNSNFGVC